MATSSNDKPSQSSPFPTSDSMSGNTGSNASNAGGATRSGDGQAGGSGSGEELMERVVQGAHKAVDRVAEKAAPAVERIKHRVDNAAETVHSQTDRMRAMEEEWIDATRTCVRNHPLASVGVAVLAGMMLSRMMSSR